MDLQIPCRDGIPFGENLATRLTSINHRDVVITDNFKCRSFDDYCRFFIDTNTHEVGVINRGQSQAIETPFLQEMLVDDDGWPEPQSVHQIRSGSRFQAVQIGPTTDHHLGHDGCSSAGPCDRHSGAMSTTYDLFDSRPTQAVHEHPLQATRKPDQIRFVQNPFSPLRFLQVDQFHLSRSLSLPEFQ